MKILHITRSNGGDAPGRFVAALAERQRKAGHEVTLVVQQASGDMENVLALPTPTQAWQVNLLKQQDERGLFDLYAPQLLNLFDKDEFSQADIVHLHDISGGYFSYLLFPFLTAKLLSRSFTHKVKLCFDKKSPAYG